jgi:FkbM family methyltransferase
VKCWRALGARVVAVEPQPDLLRVLSLLYGRDPAVTLVPEAVGARPGQAPLWVSDRHPTVTTLSAAWAEEVGQRPDFRGVRWRRAGEVRVTTLDELIRRFGMPDFVKIDVEGLEGEVLAGLSHPPPALSFEYLTAARDRALTCVDRLEALGEYRYNGSPGESHQLSSARWLDAAGIRTALASLTQGSGDVYAWRADVACGTRAEGSQQGLGEVRHAAQGRAPGDQAGDEALGHKGIPDLRPLGDEVDRDLPGGPLPADGGQGLVVPEHQQHQIQVGPEP